MTARTRVRRRLLILSAPVAVLVLLVVLKLVSMVAAGNSAVDDYAAGDVDGLAGDVAVLQFGNVVEAAKAPFAAGTLAVLDGRLADADAEFGEALRRTDPAQSCPVRLNLELVRETQGDLAGFARDPDRARERYTSALAAVEEAPPGCFAGNDDPDPERRAVRADAAERLTAKIANVEAMPPPPPPPPPPPAGAPPPPPPTAGPTDEPEPDASRRLDPREGDPLERLQQVLRDAAEATPEG